MTNGSNKVERQADREIKRRVREKYGYAIDPPGAKLLNGAFLCLAVVLFILTILNILNK